MYAGSDEYPPVSSLRTSISAAVGDPVIEEPQDDNVNDATSAIEAHPIILTVCIAAPYLLFANIEYCAEMR